MPAYAGAAKRAFSEFRRHEMTDVAAALTYYAMMSLFPAIVLATSLFSLIGDEQTVTKAVDYLARQGADADDAGRGPRGDGEDRQRVGRRGVGGAGRLGGDRAQRRVGRVRRGGARAEPRLRAPRRTAASCDRS